VKWGYNRNCYIPDIDYNRIDAQKMPSTDVRSNNNENKPSRRILLVDDELDVISVFKMILEMNGYEVDTYTNPTTALDYFKPNFYGLLLLDIRMPTMNGFELYRKIRIIDDKVKVCFITAYEDYREEFKEFFPMLDEFKYFIRKPKAIEDLVNHVSTILG
jgi:two-component system, OmpR family, response regulator ChvI